MNHLHESILILATANAFGLLCLPITVVKKTAASTKNVKATKSTATDEIIKRYKTAKNPAVEQAATEVLSHKYSNQKRPTNREILAKIKGCKPEEVLNEEIKQVKDLVPTNRLGTCLNVWEKPGYPINIHIKFGEIFYFYLFHSEIIKLRIFKINNFTQTIPNRFRIY